MGNNALIELSDDTVLMIRRSHDLDDEKRRREAVGSLREWVQKQDHFLKKDFSDEFLEKRILTCKGSLERAKCMLDRLCTFRTLTPQLFGVYNVKEDFGNMRDNVIALALPKILEKDLRVYVIKFYDRDPVRKFFMNYLRYIIVMCEYLAAHDYLEKICIIYDLQEANLANLLTDMDVIEMKREITALLEGYGARPQKMFVITKSKVVGALISVFRAFVKPKIIDRLQIIKSHQELHDHIPREMLPKDYGGEEPSLKDLQDLWNRVLSSEDTMDILRAASEARTDESLRTVGHFCEQYAGTPGTFRYLNVD